MDKAQLLAILAGIASSLAEIADEVRERCAHINQQRLHQARQDLDAVTQLIGSTELVDDGQLPGVNPDPWAGFTLPPVVAELLEVAKATQERSAQAMERIAAALESAPVPAAPAAAADTTTQATAAS